MQHEEKRAADRYEVTAIRAGASRERRCAHKTQMLALQAMLDPVDEERGRPCPLPALSWLLIALPLGDLRLQAPGLLESAPMSSPRPAVDWCIGGRGQVFAALNCPLPDVAWNARSLWDRCGASVVP